MACYAAVLSLYHTINNINIHPCPPNSLDQKQLHSLTQNLTFFIDFLESHPSYEGDDLEGRIIAAAYAAEDLIETHIVNQIHARSTSHDHGQSVGCLDFFKAVCRRVMNLIMGGHGDLERVIQEMDLIKTKLMDLIIQPMTVRPQHTYSSSEGPTASTWHSNIIPVFDDAMIIQVLEKLTGQPSSLQIIRIVGMGGIGKTAFTTCIYTKPLIEHHFDIWAWVTISQEYTRRNILQALCQEVKGSNMGLSEKSEDEIGEILYKYLFGRRYLIVMDDIWSVDAWDIFKSYFPDNKNGSRVLITTRISNLAFGLSSGHEFQMKFLDEDKSWDLLRGIVFGKQDCPNELEKIGKEIAKKCKGLPLSIAVIGGLLRKSNMTQAYWIYTIENLNLLISSEDDEHALRILRTSYRELPMHLKPCFLYMGVFLEDNKIKTSMLIKLWVSEGFLKPNDAKSLEEVGEEYLKELIERNLVLIHKLRWNGEAKICQIHDLLRDVCSREAKRQKFLCVVRRQKHHTPQGIDMERRIYIDQENTNEEYSPGLLRVYSPVGICNSIATNIPEQANLRYLSLKVHLQDAAPRLVSLCSLLWNLQTLKIRVENLYSTEPRIAPPEIWEMSRLRHVMLQEFVLPDPPNGEHNFVLENLQTLSGIIDFKFSDEVVKRIPNIKKLKLVYKSDALDFCLNNLGRLQKLESLSLEVSFNDCHDAGNIRKNLGSFPHSLKKLTLARTRLNWKDLTERIGNLPLLQVLKLKLNACVGCSWETSEGQFCSLRDLQILGCDSLIWDTDNFHFPRLEYLSVKFMIELVKIPSSIGHITTLKKIWLVCCSKDAADSARRIKEEQKEYGNEDLQVVTDHCFYKEYKADMPEKMPILPGSFHETRKLYHHFHYRLPLGSIFVQTRFSPGSRLRKFYHDHDLMV